MIKPFLQWPGGKTKVMPFILPHLGLPCRRFVDVCCGSGAASLAVAEVNGAKRIWLNDINPELIICLALTAVIPLEIIALAREIYNPEHNNEEAYYQIRKEFNAQRGSGTSNQAARLIYLNRHGFNSLMRFNSKGEFNVSFRVDHSASEFPEEAIRDFARLLGGADFTCWDFEDVLLFCGAGDTVYLDPPFLPLSATANFTAYSKDGFSWGDQQRLAKAAQAAADRGARVVISQANIPAAHGLYAGAEIHEIEVHRSISCKASSRGKAKEIIAVYHPKAAEAAS
jgi:DNA adenine methylase